MGRRNNKNESFGGFEDGLEGGKKRRKKSRRDHVKEREVEPEEVPERIRELFDSVEAERQSEAEASVPEPTAEVKAAENKDNSERKGNIKLLNDKEASAQLVRMAAKHRQGKGKESVVKPVETEKPREVELEPVIEESAPKIPESDSPDILEKLETFADRQESFNDLLAEIDAGLEELGESSQNISNASEDEPVVDVDEWAPLDDEDVMSEQSGDASRPLSYFERDGGTDPDITGSRPEDELEPSSFGRGVFSGLEFSERLPGSITLGPEDLQEIINSAKLFSAIKERKPGSSDSFIRQEAIRESGFIRIDKLEDDNTVSVVINRLIENILKNGNVDDVGEELDSLALTVGLESNSIENLMASQQEWINEQAEQRMVSRGSLKSKLAKVGLRLAGYSAVSVGLGALTGGLGAGVGLAGVRLADTYLATKKRQKAIEAKRGEVLDYLGGDEGKARLRSRMMAELALAKRIQIEQVDSPDAEFYKIDVIRSFIEDSCQLESEAEKQEIADSLKALEVVSNRTEFLASRFTEQPVGKKLAEKFSFLAGGKKMSEKMVTAGVFSVASILARQTPFVRQALSGFAGWRIGSVMGERSAQKMDKFEELRIVTAEELGEDPDLLFRVLTQLKDDKFRKSSPEEFVALREVADRLLAEKVSTAEGARSLIVAEDNNKLFNAFEHRYKLIGKKKRAKVAYQVAGLVGGLALGSLIGEIGSSDGGIESGVELTDHIEGEPSPALVDVEVEPAEAASVVKANESVDYSRVADLFYRTSEEHDASEPALSPDLSFRADHHLLDMSGADIHVDADTGITSVGYEIGQDGDFASLDQALRRIVVQEFDVGADKKFDLVEGARAENVLANIRMLLDGHKVGDIDPDKVKDIISFNSEDGSLVISDYSKFNSEVLGPLIDRASDNITAESEAVDYVNNTSVKTWQEIFDQRKEADEAIQIGFEDRVAQKATEQLESGHEFAGSHGMVMGSNNEAMSYISELLPEANSSDVEKYLGAAKSAHLDIFNTEGNGFSDDLKTFMRICSHDNGFESLFLNEAGELDESQVSLAGELIKSGIDQSKIAKSLELTKLIDWSAEKELAFAKMVANPDNRDGLAELWGKELIREKTKFLYQPEEGKLVFERLGGLGGRTEINLVKGKIFVGMRGLPRQKFDLNNFSGVIKYLSRE